MKDSEFIELLNLYLDHELSAQDSARLEAEVARDPQRRQLYHQYCRMQKACVVLAEQSRASAPVEEPISVATFAPRPRPAWNTGLWATGLLAAAACVAVTLVNRRQAASFAADRSGADLAQSVVTLPAPTAAAVPAHNEFQLALTTHALGSSSARPAGFLLPAAEATGQFAWMNQLKLTPIQLVSADKLFLEAKPALEFDARAANGAPSSAVPAEITAFQFAK